jgi:hypothetical protein
MRTVYKHFKLWFLATYGKQAFRPGTERCEALQHAYEAGYKEGCVQTLADLHHGTFVCEVER